MSERSLRRLEPKKRQKKQKPQQRRLASVQNVNASSADAKKWSARQTLSDLDTRWVAESDTNKEDAWKARLGEAAAKRCATIIVD